MQILRYSSSRVEQGSATAPSFRLISLPGVAWHETWVRRSRAQVWQAHRTPRRGEIAMAFRTASVSAFIATIGFAHAAYTGTITGTLKLKGNAQPAVVYVETTSGTFAPSTAHAHMDQKGMTFIPYLLPILAGTTVDFLNSDSVNHNVFSPDNEGYNLGTWPKGEIRPHAFKKVGTYTQLCSVHPEMEAFVLVLQNPYFAVVDKDGSFKIADVPDGHYVLKVFAKKLKKAEKEKNFPVDVVKGAGTAAIAF
jgi:plastocyanin